MGEGPQGDRVDWLDRFAAARADGDADAMAEAALGLASTQRFGTHAGRLPAVLFDAYVAAQDNPALRVRTAAALARTWVYGNDAARGQPFADEAVQLAVEVGDDALLAIALDAQLTTRWGPDDLADRLHLATRLQDVAAHLDDGDVRLRAHLWRLTTALENLDVVGVQRQLAALETLADETAAPLMRFFAASRRSMYALLVGDPTRAEEWLEVARAAGAAAEVPDLYAIERSIAADLARQRHDREALAGEAAIYASYATDEGIPSILAEAAVLWLDAGDTVQAARLAAQVAGDRFAAIPRDVDFVLTVAKTVEAAAGCGLVEIAVAGAELLSPYAGRAVVNAGAVNFHGVVDDYLYLAAEAAGDETAVQRRAAAANAYRRLGATWWLGRLSPQPATPASTAPAPKRELQFRPLSGQSVWVVGSADDVHLVADAKGLHYLRILLSRPGADVAAAELVAAVDGHPALRDANAGEHLDQRALAAYRQRLKDIDEDLAESTEWADSGRTELLEREREQLLAELGRATGLHGRVRRFGSPDERARVAVRKAIAAALDRLDQTDRVVARLLRRNVRTGGSCRYEPDPDEPIVWRLEPSDR